MAGLWVAVTAWTYGIRVSPDPASDSSDSTSKGRASLNESFTANQMPFDIYLSPPEITSTEKEWIAKALDSGYVAPVGPQVEQFEAGLSDYLGLEAIQAVSSGTAAIHLGLRALGVGPGDCVICPDLTFVASVNPVRYLGGEPVLVDIDPTNWAIDPAVAREAIRTLKAEGRVVRAMVIVHPLGIPAPMDELMQLAEEEGVAVLEDCAGAFGTTVNGVSAGSFGDAATLSFNGNKILTTSGGGGLYLKDASKRAETRIWANQGKDAGALGYQHGTLGYNYRLSNICAAIGLGQLETVDRRLARKKSIFRGYQERFSEFAEIGFMPEPEHGVGNYWLSNISLDVGCESTEIVRAMRSEGIEAAPMWRPMSQQTVNAGLRYFGGTAGDTIFRKFLSLPCGSALTDTQLDFVAETLKRKIQIAR
jgi:pyridoxal phosphate-dependent aminotransferase EpsN